MTITIEIDKENRKIYIGDDYSSGAVYDGSTAEEIALAVKTYIEDYEREETEICPYCNQETIVNCDVEKNGYKTYCQHCGKEIMLCDACLNADDNIGQFCDWCKDGKCFRQAEEENA